VTAALESATYPTAGRTWLRWAVGTFVVVESVHFAAGLFFNDWEGWSTLVANLVFVVVTGVVLVGATFGLFARWALRDEERAGKGALGVALVSLASYAIFFTWAPFVTAVAALLLGRTALVGAPTGRAARAARIGMGLGALSLAIGVSMLAYAAFNGGDYPFGL